MPSRSALNFDPGGCLRTYLGGPYSPILGVLGKIDTDTSGCPAHPRARPHTCSLSRHVPCNLIIYVLRTFWGAVAPRVVSRNPPGPRETVASGGSVAQVAPRHNRPGAGDLRKVTKGT